MPLAEFVGISLFSRVNFYYLHKLLYLCNLLIEKTETSIYNFNCFLEDDFPNVFLDDSKDPITFDGLKFKETINKSFFNTF